ncbi:MAG: pyruvate formate lyase activating enzyme [Bacteroidetes bacterium]|nr:MAG: pyruvate formate lyase activating enzyme [Bacteroidota bacterium]
MNGYVFDIRHFSVHDGPGIRTAVFLKGCPLRCIWCHNPESHDMLPVRINVEKGIGDKRIKLPETIGKLVSPGDVLEEVLKSRVFFEESGGGVTFTGGEPLMQPSFMIECIRLMKENDIHTTLDTSGYASPEDFGTVVKETDLVLFDLKHPDAERHLEFTGGSLETVLRNLHCDTLSEKPIIVRIPLVPGFNMSNTVYKQMAVILAKLKNLRRIDLLPYHNFSLHKYLRLGLDFKMEGIPAPDNKEVAAAADFFRNFGFIVSVGG